ncbi:MAG: hypothetical protein AB198_01580 [Parcubacteria bacterium C7867-003]|nr:MAG: hypothetical protein AB198_01580 [Parcubacteria bacterium C7867-003]
MENKKLWFKAKRFGYGWYPCSWEGWAVILLYLIVVIVHTINVEKFVKSGADLILNFLIPLIINTIFLIIISHARGEKASWRWK